MRGTSATFARAAARRYPGVHLWQIWGEPSRQNNFKPLPRFEATGPRRYASILDAAYGSLKRESRRNLVIGGNTFTTGDVSPRQFIRSMRLPNGRPPRMDLYGHNPFTLRRPALRQGPLGHGYADFSDFDTLAGWIDQNLGRRRGRPIRLFLSEFTFPTDHPNYEFNFWVTRRIQARWLATALQVTRAMEARLRARLARAVRRKAERSRRQARRRSQSRAFGMGRGQEAVVPSIQARLTCLFLN